MTRATAFNHTQTVRQLPLFPLLMAFALTMSKSQAQTSLPAPTATAPTATAPTATAPTATAPRFAAVRRVVPLGEPSFTSQELGFAARFPMRPAQTVIPLATITGEKLKIFTFTAQNKGVTYVIQATPTLPTIDLTSPQRQLDSVQQGLIASSDAVLQKRESLRLNDFPGRDLKFAVAAGTRTLRVRAYLSPLAFYCVFAVGLQGAMTTQSAQVEAFLDSLRILPRPAAPPAPLFRSSKFKFSVQLPVKPVEREQVSPLPGGGENITVKTFVTQTEAVNYLVIVTTIGSSSDLSDTSALLAAYEKVMLTAAAVKSPGTNVQKRSDIRLGEFPGRELKISTLKGTATTLARIYLTPRAFYTLLATGINADMQRLSQQTTLVFDSFRILPQ